MFFTTLLVPKAGALSDYSRFAKDAKTAEKVYIFFSKENNELLRGLSRSSSFIDTEGRVRFSHHSRNPADHPKSEELLSALEMI